MQVVQLRDNLCVNNGGAIALLGYLLRDKPCCCRGGNRILGLDRLGDLKPKAGVPLGRDSHE